MPNQLHLPTKSRDRLVGQARGLATDEDELRTALQSATVKIFPVLITHYETFNTGGFNYILNYWFKEELDALRKEGLDILRVQPLVCIDMDTLIFFQDIFSDATLPLETAIQSYINFVHLVPTQILLPTEILKKYKEESHYPFSFYMRKEVDKLSKEFLSPAAFQELVKRLEPNPAT